MVMMMMTTMMMITMMKINDDCGDGDDAEAPLAGPHPSDACRPPSAPCGVGTGPTRWTAISTWQYPDGHAPPTNGTTSASRRSPRMGTRWPIPLLSTGKPLRGATPTHHHDDDDNIDP